MPIKIFFCYAHEDETFLNTLKKHLQPLHRQGLIAMWHDRDVRAGTEWEHEITEHINNADIILLLISPDFMDSDYCYGTEMKRAIERHEQRATRVIPIILRPTYWQGVLGKLQAIPKNALPIVNQSWHTQDDAFHDVVGSIRKVIEELQSQTNAKREQVKTEEGLKQPSTNAFPTSYNDPRGPSSQFNQSKQQVQHQQNAGRDVIITNIQHHPWIAILLVAVLLLGSLVVGYRINPRGLSSLITPLPSPAPSATPSPSPVPSANPWLLLPGKTITTQTTLNGVSPSSGMHYLGVGVMFRNTSSQMQFLDPNNLELVSTAGKVYEEDPNSPKRGQLSVPAKASSGSIGVYFEVPIAKACFLLTISDNSGGRIGNWPIGDGC